MSALAFNMMTDSSRWADVVAMMSALYRDDPAQSPPSPARFPITIEFLLSNPDRGRIILIERDTDLLGYAILIPYWSNEFGGTLLFIDELYVNPSARGQGIGRAFFAFIESDRPFNPTALALEVSPTNNRARRLYESIGFTRRTSTTLTRQLPPPEK